MKKIDLYPEKAQFISGEEISFVLEQVLNDSKNNKYMLKIFQLDQVVITKEIEYNKGRFENEKNRIVISEFSKKDAGYGVELYDEMGKRVAATAFDVTSNLGQSIRYGFLSDFEEEDGKNNRDIDFMTKMHINFIQYYDWSYRHDQLVSSENEYTDMMGKKINRAVLKSKIEYARTKGQKSIAYGAVYAASKDYYQEHTEEALYQGNDEVIKFIDTFYLMNIHEKNAWHAHIIEEYKKAIGQMNFDGIHMDTYGFPKEAYGIIDNKKKKIYLKDHFSTLINHTKEELTPIKKENYLIFNNVGNWPVKTVADSMQTAMYIEVWKPYERYFHIMQIIKEAKSACKNKKPVILAAYLEPFRLEQPDRAGNSAQLLMAFIVSSGGSHLLLGEEKGILTQGYYVDHSKLSDGQEEVMRNYYDFMIRYLELFYDSSMEDVSMTHIGWDNYEYYIEKANYSVYGEANKISYILRQNKEFKTISMINLCGQQEDYWNKGKNKPEIQKDILFRVHVDQKIQNICLATPDANQGKSIELEYIYVHNEKGIFVEFVIPSIEYWNLIYIKM
jgi:dextranase